MTIVGARSADKAGKRVGDHMSLKIIGAGFGRTGTHSLKLALEQLGFAPCNFPGAPVPATPFPKVNTTGDFRNYNRKAAGGHGV